MKTSEKQFLMMLAAASLALGGLVIGGLIYLAGGRPTLAQALIVNRIETAAATAEGKTVEEIFRDLGVANTIWTIEDGDWRGFEGKAFAACFLKDGSALLFAWQWDAAWPHALALTPNTAATFPRMDPGVELTPYGQSSLQSGRPALQMYFRPD